MPSQSFLIELKDLRFHAFHGLYPEEKKTGGEFLVNLAVAYDPIVNGAPISLSDTVDYAVMYEICLQFMTQPTELLENVARSISDAIQTRFERAHRIEVTITKCKPPILGCTGSSTVKYTWES